jgi:exodeoxyribonuclease III
VTSWRIRHQSSAVSLVNSPQTSAAGRAISKPARRRSGAATKKVSSTGSHLNQGGAIGRAYPAGSSGGTVGLVRIATWNVNSVKQRLPRLLPWLEERRPDVVCLQETKLDDDAFHDLLGDELAERRYEYAAHGEASWNGVAILSRVGLEEVAVGLDGAPGFPHAEARAVAATCGGIRVHSVYVPNGREPDSDHYRYKLAWLAALRDVVAAGPEATVVCGDLNIAPTDADVFDPDAYVGQTHVTAPERAALADLRALGLRDVIRDRWPEERVFTYWDYRAGMFHRDLGMRIDLVLAGAPVASRIHAAWVDRKARKGKGPSDHAPVIVDLDEAPDGDIGPVVPPPSAPVTKRGAARLPQSM